MSYKDELTNGVNSIPAPSGFKYLAPKETEWKPAPAPKKPGRFLVRNKGALNGAVLHHEHWLFKEIHGEDYEWCHEDDL